jgi:hypothetical protein
MTIHGQAAPIPRQALKAHGNGTPAEAGCRGACGAMAGNGRLAGTMPTVVGWGQESRQLVCLIMH